MPTVVAYAGHLYPWKGVDVLLEALALGARTHAALIVGGHAGEPDLARLQALAQQLGIGDRVTFTGLVAPARGAGTAARRDVLALPNPASAISTRYTSPLKLFEYMAAGRADRRLGSAVDPRGSAPRRRTRCWSRPGMPTGAGRRRSRGRRAIAAAAPRLRSRRRGSTPRSTTTRGIAAPKRLEDDLLAVR